MKLVIRVFIVLLVFCGYANAQVTKKPRASKKLVKRESLKEFNPDTVRGNSKPTREIKVETTTASDYKFISIDNDTTYIDTTLSIQKEYKYNYLKKDYFELLPFSNTGQVFNQLGYNFTENTDVFSKFGARAKHMDYAEVDDIYYYEVATPLTELFFKTTMEQGQLAEGFFTVNTTPRFNMSIAYKGLRSLGKYRHIKANSGKFRSSFNYRTKNNRYFARAHVAMQSIENEENGGITDLMVDQFESENTEFNDRSRFEVNFEDADNKLSAKRFYINHYYNLLKQQDSISNYTLNIGHVANLEDKKYQFNQGRANVFFGDAFTTSVTDEVRLEQFYNQGYVSLDKKKLGRIKAHVGYTDYNYGYNSVVNLATGFVPNRLKGGFASYGVSYVNEFGKLKLMSDFKSNLSKDNKGSLFDASLVYVTSGITAKAKLMYNEALPDFNYRLFQSDYKNYNWFNSGFKTQQVQTIAAEVDVEKYIQLKATYTTLDNYTYFGLNGITNSVKPFQENTSIKYLKLSANKEFKYRKFALDNTIQYQSVAQENAILNVPELIVRNTLYFTDVLFDKNLFLQTGVVFNYFTAYKMNAYDPLLSEFYVQTQNEYGAYPRIDFFVNAKIRNARIYLKAEHFNSSFTGNTFYSAPNYPYKDFTVRFGLVWDFFL
ncbi:MAG: putative porin [Flavobacteriaceae bacterium]